MKRISDDKHGIFFIDGPGGTGKTFLYEHCLLKLEHQMALQLPQLHLRSTTKLLVKATIIIWDEVLMCKKYTIEALDCTLQDIMEPSLPFGGEVVFGGDFRPILPVVPRATREETIDLSLVRSYLWKEMEILILTKNMLAKNYYEFSDYLLRISNGDEVTVPDSLVQILVDMLIEYEDGKDNKKND
ncbi:uncharacterized protein LOC143878155 [Tasmannia lanceolata]|uniref:uncharacterized protein LOC143878155 n=1 Tax=Tasmannia lanceolata TaxID=3420 RepID=UPI0040628E6E